MYICSIINNIKLSLSILYLNFLPWVSFSFRQETNLWLIPLCYKLTPTPWYLCYTSVHWLQGCQWNKQQQIPKNHHRLVQTDLTMKLCCQVLLFKITKEDVGCSRPRHIHPSLNVIWSPKANLTCTIHQHPPPDHQLNRKARARWRRSSFKLNQCWGLDCPSSACPTKIFVCSLIWLTKQSRIR